MYNNIEKVDLFILLATYMTVVDNEIDMTEMKALDMLSTPDHIITEQAKIFGDDKEKIDIDRLLEKAKELTYGEKIDLFHFLFKIIYSDNFYHSKEKQFAENIAKSIDFPISELKLIQEIEESNSNKLYVDKSKTIIENIYSFGFKLTGNKFFEKRLLGGQDFVDKIKMISKSAKSDLDFADYYMRSLNSVLVTKHKSLEDATLKIAENKRKDEASDELAKFSETLNSKLKTIIEENLRENREVLDKKKRTIDYFTIAFMGRTKAGKSTFHKVITGESNGDIGVGKLRTTRFNRAFNWENIRIVDTPGIGAPGGKSDTEIARSIIDEADLVCYVVINDSIQEIEFDFLKELKEKNKPLFIILNIKEGIANKIRFKRFLENPTKWKYESGNKSIQGHFDRINEIIKRDYDINSIEIIPVQLLAALLAEEKENNFTEKERQLLLRGSNIDEYNEKVKSTIFRTGHLKKTQNIIDGCNYQVQNVLKEINSSITEIERIRKSIVSNRDNLLKFINTESKKTKDLLGKTINSTHSALRTSVDVFVANNYSASAKDLQTRWQEHSVGKYRLCESEIKTIYSDFEKNLKNKIEEIQEDFKMEMEMFSSQVDIKTANTTNYKGFVGIAFSLATLAAGPIAAKIAFLLGLSSSPVGWVIAGIAVVGWGVSKLFESKAEKVAKAKNKIKESLLPSIEESRIKYQQKVLDNFQKTTDELSLKFNNNFSKLIRTTDEIIAILEEIKIENSKLENIFNNIVFYRILQHLSIKKQELTNELLDDFIRRNKITRDFKTSSIEITSPFTIGTKQANEVGSLLQSNITFNKL